MRVTKLLKAQQAAAKTCGAILGARFEAEGDEILCGALLACYEDALRLAAKMGKITETAAEARA